MNISRHSLFAATILATAACMAVVPTARASDTEDTGSLGAMWWQQAISIPAAQNPVLDETGGSCGIGQSGRMWFLHGSFGDTPGDPTVRACTIPAGRRIFIPILNTLCVPYPGETIEDDIQICKESIDGAPLLRLKIDGVNRNDLIRRRASTRAFSLPIPDDNILGYPSGVFQAVQDGHYALVAGLAPGRHRVHIQARTWDGFTVDVVYNLNVVRPKPQLPFTPG